MLGRVLIFGGIATSNVSTTKTHAQVDPGIARLQTFLATLGARVDLLYLVDVRAICHNSLPFGFRLILIL